MKPKILQWFRGFAVAVIGAGIKGFLIWAASSTFAAWLLQALGGVVPWVKANLVYLISLSALGIAYGLVTFWQKRSTKLAVFPPMDVDFHVLEKRISMTFTSRIEGAYKKTFKLKALRNGLSRFADKYQWTGDPDETLTCSNRHHRIVLTGTRSGFQCFEVVFDTTLNKGDEVETEICWKVLDSAKRMKPFISTTIHEPTDNLVFELGFCTGYGVEQVTQEHRPDIASGVAFQSKAVVLVNGKCKWEIPRPKLLHHYEIKWQTPSS